MTTANVFLWGIEIGAVTWQDDREVGVFQYYPKFIKSQIQVAPLMMRLGEYPYSFPGLARDTFKGLPGLLADSLPDKFGNAIIDVWLATIGRSSSSFNFVERLCYIGKRGMGALEFEPAYLDSPTKSNIVEVANLVKLADMVLNQRASLVGVFNGTDDRKALEDIIRVGASAGGARAKAILAWNPNTNEFMSGQVKVEKGFEHWLLKFDGVKNNSDKEISDPLGYGKIEYAYYLMALEIGIEMTKCRIHEEGGRSHFMTKRFDRLENGKKIHMQSLGAIAHFDFNQQGSYSYEQAINVIKRLQLSRKDMEQQVLRAIFNVVGRNHDDHVKNIAFLMNRRGEWKLAPAFDMTYAFNPNGDWTSQHQMSINNKRESFKRQDIIELADKAGIKKAKANDMLDHTISIFSRWLNFADKAKIEESIAVKIQKTHRICFD